MSWKNPTLLESVNYELAIERIDRKVAARKAKVARIFRGSGGARFQVGDIVAPNSHPNFVCVVIDTVGDINQSVCGQYLKEPQFKEWYTFDRVHKLSRRKAKEFKEYYNA